MKPICLLFVLPLLGTGCRTEQSAYLEKALSQLERIERVAYRRSSESYLPGDTIPRRYLRYYVEQRNRADTTLRHSYLSYYNADDTTRIDGGYDGTIAVDLDHDRREVVIDDFSIPRAPYRLTDMTFFCRAEAILRYVLTTSDPIRTEFTPCGDGYRLRLDIDRDCVVEFWGRPYYNRPPRELFPEAKHSAYEIVFDSERMPRKLRREQTHQITVDSVFDVRIDYEPQAPLRLEAYYPDGYMLRKRKLRNQAKKPYDIVGRQAPDWTLVDADSTAVSLGDLRSRVLLIQFTGIGCGPCHASIPFLRSLEERYTPADVGVVAIETWGTPLRSIGVYVRRNRINYPMLAGTDETVDAYLPDRAVPVYLLVDAERRVRHALCGYTPPRATARSPRRSTACYANNNGAHGGVRRPDARPRVRRTKKENTTCEYRNYRPFSLRCWPARRPLHRRSTTTTSPTDASVRYSWRASAPRPTANTTPRSATATSSATAMPSTTRARPCCPQPRRRAPWPSIRSTAPPARGATPAAAGST